LLNEVIDFRIVKKVGVIARASPGEDVEVRKMLLGMVDDFHAGVFVIDGDDENFGFGSSGGVQQLEPGGVTIITLEADAADEIDVVAVLFQNGGHVTGTAQETDDGVAETSEASEEDAGVIVFDIGFGRGFRFGSAKSWENEALQGDEENGR
jgi:hypothetical protein